MAEVRKSLAYSIASKYLIRLINLASVIFVARMLTPDELGVFAIASALILIASELKSFGADGYLVREKDIDQVMVAKALGVSSIISWTVGLIVLASSWQIEAFYQQKDIALLIQLLSISFFLSPHIGVGKSLMARNFKFERLFVVESISQSCQFFCVILFVYLGYSYFSLALSTAIGYLVELLLVIYFKPEYFCYKPVVKHIHVVARFGMYVSFANLFRKMSMTLPDLIIGKLGTPKEVAFFSRGSGFISFLTMTINSGIRPVIGPYLADKRRKGHELIDPYLHASRMLAGIMIPVLAVSSYASLLIILLMFGEQWVVSAPLVSILCIAAMIRAMMAMSIPVLITAGFEKYVFYKNLFVFVLTGCLVFALYPSGLSAIAYGFIVTAIADLLITIALLKRFIAIPLRKQLFNHIPNLVIAAICVLLVFALDMLIDIDSLPIFVGLVAVGSVAAVAWLASVMLMKHPLSSEIKRVFVAIQSKLKTG